jgi:CheY-like chemotaxis protein
LDVEDRRRAEEGLRLADRRKDEFLATLAHELRNPLAPMRNGLELLKSAAGNPALLENVRGLMERQVLHMIRLVDDLLDVSRITRGNIPIRKQRIDLLSVVHGAIESATPMIDARRQRLEVSLPDEPVHVAADATRLAQVIANLLSNACKYTEEDGSIQLAVSVDGDDALVNVRDNGIGIAAENLPRVFDMFTQVAPALERSHGGLGIGLALVKGLVELHQGSVVARSDGLGKGSEFIVRLPVAQLTQDHAPVTTGPKVLANGPARRILVVDDNRDGATSLSTLLRLMGHTTSTAHDGESAIATAEDFRPEIVLLDIGLPKLNGYDVARRIRLAPWGKDVTLVAVTGWGQEEDKRQALNAGFDLHLTKPMDANAALHIIERHRKS